MHLQVANVFTTAMRERLPKSNPLRSFLVPFTYGTISINDAARQTLVQPDSWLPRALPFNDEGLQLVWGTAYLLTPQAERGHRPESKAFVFSLFDRGAECNARIASGVDTPYWRQALEYWDLLLAFVTRSLKIYWPDMRVLAADPDVRDFMLQVIGSMQATSGLMTGQCGDRAAWWDSFDDDEKEFLIVHAIAQFANIVTAGHEQTGKVQAYAQDASFTAFSWSAKLRAEGVLAAPKDIALGQGLIMSLTGTPMPRLLVTKPAENWSAIWLRRTAEEGAALDANFQSFQESLAAMSLRCAEYNATADKRPFPNNFGLWSFDPAVLETSVSI